MSDCEFELVGNTDSIDEVETPGPGHVSQSEADWGWQIEQLREEKEDERGIPISPESFLQDSVNEGIEEESSVIHQESEINDPDDSFFERFSSIRIQYEKSERKTIEEFQFHPDAVDSQLANQLWPTLGGWNADDLYKEVLTSLLHTMISREQSESEKLIVHLQHIFRVDNDKHQKLLQSAREKEAPPLVLNLEVVEAKGLKGKDMNGLSDPFCTLYVRNQTKHNTSMKPETLDPVWREYFYFPITNPQEEHLYIEIWDYDPIETLQDKMKRFGEVKSTRGLRILMKEIALTASTGKKTHEFLGCLKIPIKNIPPDGFDSWFPLESRNGNGHKKKGEIHLRMALGAEKEKKVAAQEYRHVLHLILVHELFEESIDPHVWDGTFTKNSETILRQIQWQGGLTPKDIDLAKWLVFSRVQCDHPLNAKLFPPIFESINEHLELQAINDDESKKFWFLTEKLVENFTNFFRNIHQCFLTNSGSTSQIYYMLKTLELIKTYLKKRVRTGKEIESKVTADFITDRTEDAICRGAHELFSSIHQGELKSNEEGIESLIRIGQLLIADSRKGLEILHSVFKELLGINYFDITYRVYDEKYGELIKPLVEELSRHLKPLDLKDSDVDSCQEKDVSVGTNLFELYLAAKQFAELSRELSSKEDLYIFGVYNNWFHSSVAQWLDIAWYKAMNRIKKAVQIDNLKPIDNFVQISSSAVDTAHIFHQIQIFWNQLAWPEVEGSYTFIAKILDDLCRCTIYYAELMCSRVEEFERKGGDKYEISDELCLAINNVEHVWMSMAPISENLGKESILNQLSEKKGELIGAQCRRTLNTVVENATENINNKIFEILDKVGLKIKPIIFRLLLEGCEIDDENAGMDKAIKYLDNNLIKLKNKMTPVSFNRILDIIWDYTSTALEDLVHTNIEKRRPPNFFNQIHNMLQILMNFFYPDGIPESIENARMRKIKSLVQLHGAYTKDLILKYSQERYEEQKKVNKPGENGMLTIRAQYCEDIHTLRIEILNARNLKSSDANGQCDPFVKIKLIPDEFFPNSPKLKTKVKKKTLFPLFDETFSILISPLEMSHGGLIMFSLKDHDLFGRNDFIGEVFVPLDSVPFTPSDAKLTDLPQVNLSLTKPNQANSIILQTLENRQWDKGAFEFAKKERQKMLGVQNPI